MRYWAELVTEKSWDTLKTLRKQIDFVLIGGWAAWLWAHTLKSKDVDIIVDFENLDKLKHSYIIKKNTRLKKYEAVVDEIDVDIYVSFYSKLAVPVEEIAKHTVIIENFKVPKPELLIILKQGAELIRKDAEKGLKDRVDILSLLIHCGFDFNFYFKLLKKYKLENYLTRLTEIIKNFKEIKYLGLNPRQFKLEKEKLLKKIKKIK